MKKRIWSVILALALLLALAPGGAAKTLESAKAENIFFYAANAAGKAVLLKVIPLEDLKKIAHGQADGKNYYISSTDNYPTTQYCEARGVTIPELVDYVKSKTSVSGAAALGFSGGDILRLMATDSFGNYNRVWTYDELYGAPRYYFEGLFAKTGWRPAWEIAGEDNSKFGVTLEEYNEKYKVSDPYYADKRAVFDGGVVSVPILATESFSGRTTADALVASTEIGIAGYIAANGGVAAGSLKNELADTWSLRLSLPMTEADLMAAHRTSFDNFKWTYNLKLDMENAPKLPSLGTVAEPAASVTVSGDMLTIAISCATPGASVYYSFDGAPQIPYTKPVTVNVAGRDLAADPVTFYMTAVKEGWDDAGVITAKYPGLAPAFQTLYSGMASTPLTFAAQENVAASDWAAWAGASTFITIKTPSVNGYVRVDAGKYKIDNAAKTVTFDASLFPDTGSYSFVFHAAGYADKAASLTIKKPAPELTPAKNLTVGADMAFTFDDADYQNGLSLYVTPPGGESVMISASWLDRTAPGRVTLKAAYFASASCAITEPGTYKFSFVNSRCEPGTVELQLTIGGGQVTVFDDAAPGAWYYDAVRYAADAGLMNGTGGGKFSPDAPVTRGMLVTVLGRLSNAAVGDAALGVPFTDVVAGAYYAPYVAWAAENNLITGTGGGKFSPDAYITRQDLAALMLRYAKFVGNGPTGAWAIRLPYTDVAEIADYAVEGAMFCTARGLITGLPGDLFSPRGTATRAQTAAILMRFAG
ncbi:MAG: S-layer homology domain-containing protein [Oscillospiraceae bacterium]|nr:S-layer homology domain-containing protein [Oscillospiraceae bacterium]